MGRGYSRLGSSAILPGTRIWRLKCKSGANPDDIGPLKEPPPIYITAPKFCCHSCKKYKKCRKKCNRKVIPARVGFALAALTTVEQDREMEIHMFNDDWPVRSDCVYSQICYVPKPGILENLWDECELRRRGLFGPLANRDCWEPFNSVSKRQ